MSLAIEDSWINEQAAEFDLSELDDCAVGIDATYWMNKLLESNAANEPLLSALGGLTGIESHIHEELDRWKENNITPFFVFDGQSLTGQDEVTMKRGTEAHKKTNEAWNLYFQSAAEKAVSTFGESPGAFRVQSLYPLLQKILKQRELHFLVPPYNASAQLAYFEKIDTEQCAAVMGSQELLCYPIKDSIISNIDFETKKVRAISKQALMRTLAVSEAMLIDALLMTGTSFLDVFPPLENKQLYPDEKGGNLITNAVNLLRTANKSVAEACNSYPDIVPKELNWLDKYRKARMAIQHFIHIAESGEVRVNDYDRLTQDNHEYLGLQLPAELFHYLNTGLIGSRILNCITHSQIIVQPTVDGEASEEYKNLVTSQIIPIKEQSLGLIIPRVHRGIGHKAITMRVWFDSGFSYTMNHSSLSPSPSQKVGSWDVKEQDLRAFYPADFGGPVSLEVLALANPEFVTKTTAKEKVIRGIDSANMVTSVAIWRFLHLRGYANDSHALTPWGNALATTFLSLRDSMEGRDPVPGLDEAVLLAYELVKFGLLNGKSPKDSPGYPRKGTDDDKASLALISECSSLLKLQHKACGYTGPLNRSMLAFRSLSTTVRETDRDLIEAIVASMFMYGQSERERDDQLEISQRLPFATEPDIALGIAIRTFFDDDDGTISKESRANRLKEFPEVYVPFAEALEEDFRTCASLVEAISQGIKILDDKTLPAADKQAWLSAQDYLSARPF